MSDESDEELVGDVDFDFDPVENTKKPPVPVTQSKKAKEKPPALSKQPVKKKLPAKVVPFQNDLLEAFAMGATSVKLMPKSVSTAKKNTIVKGKPVSGKSIVKQENQGEIKKVKGEGVSLSDPDKIKHGQSAKGASHSESNKRKHEQSIKEELVTPDKSSNTSDRSSKTPDKSSKTSDTKVQEEKMETSTRMNVADVKAESSVDKIVDIKPTSQALKRKADDTKETKYSAKFHKIDVLSSEDLVTPDKSSNTLDESSKTSDKSSKTSDKSSKTSDKSSKTSDKSSKTSDKSSKTSHTKVQEERKETSARMNVADIKVESSVDKIADIKPTSQALKRKADDTKETKYSAKLHKVDDLSSEVQAKSKRSPGSIKEVDCTNIQFSEDDYKSMDNYLADQMLNKFREKTTLKNGTKYIVQVSPLEIADLAHPSVQQLIHLHPTVTLIFKRQTVKFRKKKGFAEAAFSTMTELKEFVYKLTQIKVLENRIDVNIKAVNQSDLFSVSFVIHLNHNGKLLDLLDTGEDPLINKPIPVGKNSNKIQFEKVPANANAAFMHSMFPFTNNVLIKRTLVGKDSQTVYHGPVSVFFINGKWLESVLDCCSDFVVNGFPLTLIGDYKPDQRSKKIDSVEKRGVDEPDHKSEVCVDDDDAVSNMTRDVCADMLESIQKLKELEPNNPKMKKFLEMQKQMHVLQNSLEKSKESISNTTTTDSTKCGADGPEEKSKLTPAQKKYREIKPLVEADGQKEDQKRQQKESESEQKKNSKWVKNIISDFKEQEGVGSETVSVDAEKILHQRGQRIEEVKQMKTEEKCKQDEEAELRVQQEREEKRKEAERQRLIEKIEETRLKDSQKFSSSQLLWNPSSNKAVGHVSPSSSRHGSADLTGGNMRSKDDNQHFRNGRSKGDDPNDGVEERLADFARELMQQGKIGQEAHTSPMSSIPAGGPYSSSGNEYENERILTEEEYQSLVATNQIHAFPEGSLKVRVASYPNRLCPVHGCPSKTNFRDVTTFLDHWVTFHQAQTTMKFCPMCSAYFMNPDELENHIMKHHRNSLKEANEMMRNARMKVIPNPSYRNPYPFIRPLSPS